MTTQRYAMERQDDGYYRIYDKTDNTHIALIHAFQIAQYIVDELNAKKQNDSST